MPAFTAAAPGKVILFGEHAVVYDQPAIAVPVHQVQARASIFADLRSKPGEILIHAPDIGLESRLDDLDPQHPFRLMVEVLTRRLKIAHLPAFQLKISSTIPIAAGMGSGAAVTVACLRAISAFAGRALSNDEISMLAYEVEKKYHGTPSGIDNTVVAFACPIFFIRGQPFEMLPVAEPFSLLIGDSGVRSSTAEVVGDLRQRRNQDLDRYEDLFHQIGQIVLQARKPIEHGPWQALGPWMDQNHELLRALDVSSEALDRLVSAARQAGALGAKLCGAGRGGNMIALVDTDHIDQVARALYAAGAVRVICTRLQPSGKLE